MADTASSAADRAAEQARIRKERREAKIKAGGSARLNKITGLGGGVQRDAPPPAPTAGDPEEVDISVSEHFYQPPMRQRAEWNNNAMNANMNLSGGQQGPQITDEQLRQMMLGFGPSSGAGDGRAQPPPSQNPFAGMPGMEGMGMGGQGMEEDPMMKIMQQFLGANGAGNGGFPGMQQSTTTTSTNPKTYIWRLIHSLFALSLGLYILFTTPFTGTKFAREQSIYDASTNPAPGIGGINFFWIFVTSELVLQTSRFFMEKGVVRHEGWLGMVVPFLPGKWRGRVGVLSRYAGIWGTVSGDALVLVWVLGVGAWWRGM